MKADKRKRLEKAGWRVGTVQEFLNLSDEEQTMIDMRLALASSLKDRRAKRGMTQMQLASRLGSSQSRIAKMEAADVTVSLDLLIKALLTLGATPKEVGRIIAR